MKKTKIIRKEKARPKFGVGQFLAKFQLFWLEFLYFLHLPVRKVHDLTYKKSKTYKKYSDNPMTSSVHKATFAAFILSFIVFTFLQYLAPLIFNPLAPQGAYAGGNTQAWNLTADFTNNNGATGATRRDKIDVSNDEVKLSQIALLATDGDATVTGTINIKDLYENDTTGCAGVTTTRGAGKCLNKGAGTYNPTTGAIPKFGILTINAGASLVEPNPVANTPVRLEFTAQNLIINATGSINGSAKGYPGGAGGGFGVGGPDTECNVGYAGGNGYGPGFGIGGTQTNGYYAPVHPGGNANYAPGNGDTPDAGSGGGGSSGYCFSGTDGFSEGSAGTTGGAGGGAIKITVQNITLNGSISVNGVNPGSPGGSGSGGGIILTSNGAVTNAGNISATGGNGNGGSVKIYAPSITGTPVVTGGTYSSGTNPGFNTSGTLGGANNNEIGLRKGIAIASEKVTWNSITTTLDGDSITAGDQNLQASQNFKFLIKTSNDGTNWTIYDKTQATVAPANIEAAFADVNKYYGATAGAVPAFSANLNVPISQYIDFVIRLESSGYNTPVVKIMTLSYSSLNAPVNPKPWSGSTDISTTGFTNITNPTLKVDVPAMGTVASGGIPTETINAQIEVVTPSSASFSNPTNTTSIVPGGVTYSPQNISYVENTAANNTVIGALSGLSSTSYKWQVRFFDGAGRASAWSAANYF